MTVHPPKLHDGQRQVWNSPARFNVLACGRRWGKTRLGSVRCLKTASDGGRAWWVAPSYPVTQVGWRLIRNLLHRFQGRRSTCLTSWSRCPTADDPGQERRQPRWPPQRGLDFVTVDEAAFVRKDAWVEELRPALMDRKGGAYFISTPKGHNWFWEKLAERTRGR